MAETGREENETRGTKRQRNTVDKRTKQSESVAE